MITEEQAKEIWYSLNENDYSEQEVYDEVDDHCYDASRYYNTDEGVFRAIGSLFYETFDAEEVEFEGKDGECYSFPAYDNPRRR